MELERLKEMSDELGKQGYASAIGVFNKNTGKFQACFSVDGGDKVEKAARIMTLTLGTLVHAAEALNMTTGQLLKILRPALKECVKK